MGAILCVGAGGFLGAVARYLLGLLPWHGDFPLVTFAINFVGAVVIGAIAECVLARPGMLSDNAVLFAKTGLCGGFTTFSTFSLETLSLIENGKVALGCAYAGASVVVCVAGVLLGKTLVRAALGAGAQG